MKYEIDGKINKCMDDEIVSLVSMVKEYCHV